MKTAALKRSRDFALANTEAGAAELRRQLVELESNVASYAGTLAQSFAEPLTVADREGRGNTLSLAPGYALGVSTTVTQVRLAQPRAADAGRFALLFVGGAATIALLASTGSLVNGAASYSWAPATAKALLLFCDGVAYWTVG